MNSPKVIKNQSKGYGYTYNNLADLARAGVEIPPMKTAIVEGREYVFAKIGDEWIQGAQVIDIDMKGMNAAQAYGSALTYARRYTVQLVMGIACDDKTYPKGNIDFQALRDECAIIDDVESLKDLYERIKKDGISPAQEKYVNEIINKRKKELEH